MQARRQSGEALHPFARRLVLPQAAAGLVALALFAVALAGIVQLRGTAREIAVRGNPALVAAAQVETGLQSTLASLRAWMALGERRFVDERQATWEQRIWPAFFRLEELLRDQPQEMALGDLRAMLRDIESVQWHIEDVANTPGNEPATLLLRRTVTPSADSLSQALQALQALQAIGVPRAAGERDISGAALVELERSRRLLTAYLVHPTPANASGFDAALGATRQELSELVATLSVAAAPRGRPFDPDVASTLDLIAWIELELPVYAEAARRVMQIRASSGANVARAWLADYAVPDADRATALLATLVGEQQTVMRSHSGRLTVLTGRSLVLLGVVLLLLLASGFFVAYSAHAYMHRVEAAEREKKLLAQFPAANPNPVLRVDHDGHIAYANDSSGALLGMWGKQVGDVVSEQWQTIVADVLDHAGSTDLELPVEDYIYLFVVSAVVELDSVYIYGRDITKRKHAERELQLFRNLMDQTNDAVYVVDPLTARVLDVNQKACDDLRYQRSELIGANMRDIARGARTWDELVGALRRNSHLIAAGSYERRDGETFTVEANMTLTEQQGTEYMVSVVRDTTVRHQRERERDTLAVLASQLRTASGRNEMIPVVVRQLLELDDVVASAAALVDPVSGDATVVEAQGAWTLDQPRLVPAGRGLLGLAIESGEATSAADVATDARVAAEEDFGDLTGVLCTPLLVREQRIGALMVGGQRRVAPSTVSMVAAIADLVGTALHRAALHEETERRLHRLNALRSIDLAINASLDLGHTLEVLLEHVTTQLQVDGASVLLMDRDTQALECRALRGVALPQFRRLRALSGQEEVGRAAETRATVQVPDIRQVAGRGPRLRALAPEGFVGYAAVPLIAKGEVKGVLEVFAREQLQWESEWLDFLETLSVTAAIAIDNASLLTDLQLKNVDLSLAYDTTLQGWSRALDLRDKETEGHTERVTHLTVELWKTFGASKSDGIHVRRGALLHDIGKMGIPDAILLKPGKLTDEEWVVMRKHPLYAYDLLSPISYLRPALDIPYCHHEKWDGTGYPRGLEGEQIPASARIFAVVDVWDALTSDRPYRKAWSREKTLQHIVGLAGTHFAPEVVDGFLEYDREYGLPTASDADRLNGSGRSLAAS